MEQRRAAERILPCAIHRLQRRDEVVEIVVLREDVHVAPDRLRDMLLEHGDNQLVLALEVGIERAAAKSGRRRDRLDAGAADAVLLEHARRRLEQPVARVVPGRPGSHP
ncbi:uncharacterized protein YcgL (UPF0745 family) [Bradyrhizobium sp. GM0.4]